MYRNILTVHLVSLLGVHVVLANCLIGLAIKKLMRILLLITHVSSHSERPMKIRGVLTSSAIYLSRVKLIVTIGPHSIKPAISAQVSSCMVYCVSNVSKKMFNH